MHSDQDRKPEHEQHINRMVPQPKMPDMGGYTRKTAMS